MTVALSQSSYSLFHEPWWWDIVGRGRWDEITVSRGSEVVARWPFLPKRSLLGFVTLTSPPLTKWSGPWIQATSNDTPSGLSDAKRVLTELIAKLPRHDYFHQNLHCELEYWLPFHWAGFSVSTRITYRLPRVEHFSAIQHGFAKGTRRRIRKAAECVAVIASSRPEDLINTMRSTYDRQARAMPVVPELVAEIVERVIANGRGEVWTAIDDGGTVQAAALFVWDSRRTYFLLGGANSAARRNGAMSLVMSRGIEAAVSRGQSFDFEGSMIASIERFFRTFGARPVAFQTVRGGSTTRGRLYALAAGWAKSGKRVK